MADDVQATAQDIEQEPAQERPGWRGGHVREIRWQAELARLLADPVWRGRDLPRGDGAPVLLIPGFLAGDQSMSAMARWLRRLGHAPRRAGISFNVRCSDVAIDRPAGEVGDVERVVQPRAHGDDLRDLLGAAGGQRLGEVAAAAVPDDRDLAAGAQVRVVQHPLEPVDGDVGAAHVERDAGPARRVPEPAQPAGHRRHRLVAGQEARDEQHRRAVAARQVAAAPDRVGEQPGQLGLPADLAHVPAAPARALLRRLLLDVLCGGLHVVRHGSIVPPPPLIKVQDGCRRRRPHL